MKIHFLIPLLFLLLPGFGFDFIISQTGSLNAYSQGPLPAPIKTAIQSDDVELLKKEITADNINTCYGRNSLLSLCIKINAYKSLSYLLDEGIDVNLSCDEKSPTVLAIQFDRFEMLKALVEKEADLKKGYRGMSAIEYADHYDKIKPFNYLAKAGGYKIHELNGIDGPYIINDTAYAVNDKNEITTTPTKSGEKIVVKVNNEDKDQFEIQIKGEHEIPESVYKLPKKLIAISDIEGNFNSLYSFLLNNKVMDENYNWTYGDGHLALGGDFVDRGPNVMAVLWLLYHLDSQADAAGGKVHFILGNHEIMNIQGDTRYANDKYIALAQKLSGKDEWKSAFQYLFTENSEMGKWLRSKNAMERIGDYIFVHAGLSPLILDHNLSITRINKIIRKNIDRDIHENPSKETKINFLMAEWGPFWYRGLVTKKGNYEKATEKELDKVLKYYRGKRVVIGHTIAPQVQATYNGKVIMIDVKHYNEKNSGKTFGLLVEDGKEYVINDLGEKSDL